VIRRSLVWVRKMRDTRIDHGVICPKCRYTLHVHISPDQEWLVEAQCPSCGTWHCFSITDIPERQPSPPDPEESDRATQRLGERLWQPINAHTNHPTLRWFDRVGNGLFEDDYSPCSWPVPCWVYRFSKERMAAYIWQEEGSWFVRTWHSIRSHRKPPDPTEVFSFEGALDRLLE
jgi:hypothetical protein